MKKLLFIILTFLFITNLIQGSDINKTKVSHEYKGVVKLSGTDVGGGKILVDNAFKLHTLYKKAKQWADEHYETGTAMLVNKTDFTVITDEYRLQLKFKDGVFEFIFTDEGKTDEKKEQKIIDNLTEYVKTCELKNKSW
jgi:hypothetical protein